MFERECDTLRARKRQLITLESKVQETIKNNFDEFARMLTDHRMNATPIRHGAVFNVQNNISIQYKQFEEHVDQLTNLVTRTCQILFQGKGQLFNKLIEQKKLLQDPAKMDASVSQAIDLAFDNKELASVSLELSQRQRSPTGKHRLQINSRQVISLEEGEDDSLIAQQNQMDNRFRDVNTGFDQLMQNQAKRQESMEQLLADQLPSNDVKDQSASQGSQNLIDQIQKFVRDNEDMDSQRIIDVGIQQQEMSYSEEQKSEANESVQSSVQSVKNQLNALLKQEI